MQPTISRVRHLALAPAMLWLLSACSQDAPPAGQPEEAAGAATQATAEQASAPAGELDPCALLTAAEAQEITGKPFGIPVRGEEIPNVCLYETGGDPPSFNVGIVPAAAENTAELMMGRYREHGATVTEVSGFGERAFWSTQPQVGTQLNAYKGNWYVVVTGAYLADTPEQEQEVIGKLMLQVLSRL